MAIALLVLVMTWTLAPVNCANDDLETLIALKSTIDRLQLSYKSMLEKNDRITRFIYFKASFQADTRIVTSGRVVFDAVLDNKGNGYNSTTGLFQAPRTGVYVFAVQIFINGNYQAIWELRVNERSTIRYKCGPITSQSAELMYPIKLHARDQVSIYSFPEIPIYGDRSTFFAGWFITDCIDVDIGTTSCGSFDDKACYVTCSSRDIVQITACSVTINVTCDVDNVKGRYVRVRQNSTVALELCDLKVMRYLDLGKDFRNFALNAPCTQSTLYNNYWKPEKAVDGNRNGYQSMHSCSHTRPKPNHWWQVDLRKLILVSHIIIANRQDCCSERLANFTVELGRVESKGNITYSLCHYFDGIAGALTTLNCTRSIWGQFVRISKGGEPLTLCEVEVYGDTDGNNTGLLPDTNATEESTALVEVGREFTVLTTETDETTVTTETDETTVTTETDETTVTTETDETTVTTDADETTVTTETDETTVTTNTDETTATTETDETTASTALTTETRETGELTNHPQDSTMATTSSRTKYYYCACRFEPAQQKKTQQEVAKVIAQTTKALKVQHPTLGKQIRKKSTAADLRMSSTVVGIVCTTVLSSVFAVILLYDLHRLCQYLFHKVKEGTEKDRVSGQGLTASSCA